jgi:hypothetical protein
MGDDDDCSGAKSQVCFPAAGNRPLVEDVGTHLSHPNTHSLAISVSLSIRFPNLIPQCSSLSLYSRPCNLPRAANDREDNVLVKIPSCHLVYKSIEQSVER